MAVSAYALIGEQFAFFRYRRFVLNLSTFVSSAPSGKVATQLQTRLPQKIRYRFARRVLSDFSVAQSIYAAPQNSDYELKSSLEKKCIFIHMPKAAGISVAKAVYGSKAGGHLSASYYLWLFGSYYFDRIFKFTFVRNPEQRALSAYKFLLSGGMNHHDKAWSEKYVVPFKNFDEFVSRSLIVPEVFNAVHFRPQITYLRDPRNGKLAVDFIGRFEEIENSFQKLKEHVNVYSDLPHENRTKHSFEEGISPSSAIIIRKIYKQDFDTLGY